MYIAPPLPKGKLPQLPRPRETNHKSTRPRLTHRALGSLTPLPPFTFPSLLPFLLPALPMPPAVPLLGPLPQRRPSPPQHAGASQVTTAPLSPTQPARAGLPRWGDAHNRGLLMVEMGCCAARAPNQAGSHSAAATRSTMHTAAGTSTPFVCAAHCPLPTTHCPLSPFCFLPLHVVPGPVPGLH